MVLKNLCEVLIWLIVFKYLSPGDINLFNTGVSQENAGNEKSFCNIIMIIFMYWGQS